jgi:hypothetical protein
VSGWIFQGNPKQFAVDEHLRRPGPRSWLVRPERFGAQMAFGDRVFVWRSDGGRPGTGGVIALGQIAEVPEIRGVDPDAAELWVKSAHTSHGEALRVRITVDELRLSGADGMVFRSWLRWHPKLSGLQILGFPAGTTYRLREFEVAELLAAWNDQES